jgi:hypothetical protein
MKLGDNTPTFPEAAWMDLRVKAGGIGVGEFGVILAVK